MESSDEPRKYEGNGASALRLQAKIFRDLRSFEIRLESEVPIRIRFQSDVTIRKFRIGRTCRVLSYHKLRSLTVQQKHQPLRCL